MTLAQNPDVSTSNPAKCEVNDDQDHIQLNNRFTPLVDYEDSDDDDNDCDQNATREWQEVSRRRRRRRRSTQPQRDTKVTIVGASLVRDQGQFVSDPAARHTRMQLPQSGMHGRDHTPTVASLCVKRGRCGRHLRWHKQCSKGYSW